MKPFYAYLLRCADGSYYCGHTDHLDTRLAQHESGAIGYTASRLPIALVWQGEFEKREEAIAFEQQVKGWSRAKKEALIAGDWQRISALAKGGTSMRGSTSSPRTDSPSTSSGRTAADGHGQDDALLAEGIRTGQRRALAKAITLVESTRADHQQRAQALLQALLADTGKAIRIGISGVPGVGKSTFIEALGMYLIGKSHRVAVLAVDPSSSVNGGSILGDKTRMEQLSQREEAFIRPSPSAGALGGVADKTREAMLLCEAAGFDVIIVETVGVGQSETAVAGMTDIFVLLQLPNAGDDLQAIKKGIVELADLVVFNKADLDPQAADMAAAQMKSALHLLHPLSAHWQPPVLKISAAKGQGIAEFWDTVLRHREAMTACGELQTKRSHQALAWMWALIDSGLRQAFRTQPQVSAALADFIRVVDAGETTPAAAAGRLLELFAGSNNEASSPRRRGSKNVMDSRLRGDDESL